MGEEREREEKAETERWGKRRGERWGRGRDRRKGGREDGRKEGKKEGNEGMNFNIIPGCSEVITWLEQSVYFTNVTTLLSKM